MVITMTVVLPTIGEGLSVRIKTMAVKHKELIMPTMWVVQCQLYAAVLWPLLAFWISLIARKVDQYTRPAVDVAWLPLLPFGRVPGVEIPVLEKGNIRQVL